MSYYQRGLPCTVNGIDQGLCRGKLADEGSRSGSRGPGPGLGIVGGGKDDDCRRGLAGKERYQVEATGLAQMDVQDDNIRRQFAGHSASLFAIAGGGDRLGAGEFASEEAGDRG